MPAEHRIRWWVYSVGSSGQPVRIRYERTMRGQWGFDATCSCGWDSRTGGAIRPRVREYVADHKWDAAYEAARR